MDTTKKTTKRLAGKKVAMLVADGFEQEELIGPREALETAGARTFIVSPGLQTVQGWVHTKPGHSFPVDMTLSKARPEEFDALLLPGGLANPDTLRQLQEALTFVKSFFEDGKPVAAICHGPWILIDAGVVKGRSLTSYPSIRSDLLNAGAKWVDQEVVVDQGLVTSRKPADIPAFTRKMVEEFEKGNQPSRQNQGLGNP
jgi:protease I